LAIIDLSHKIQDGLTGYPGDEVPRLVPTLTHSADGILSSRIELSCHTGTHIDSPLHFRDGWPSVAEMSVAAFAGAAIRLEAPVGATPGPLAAELLTAVDLAGVDFVLLHTGWDRFWGTERYYGSWPFLGYELARLLVNADLKGVGLDTPSVDPLDGRDVHDLFAACGYINIENLTNLASLPPDRFTFMALPLKLAGVEASPVRAVAVI